MPDPFTRLRSALADRYTIEGKLGEGGMATVYLAEDLKHHRRVALKVLLPDLAATVGAERFLREIELAARLQHPNILPVHDSGEADGFLYYVMPYVEGESLRDRLERGEVAIPDAVRILTEVADALSYAHAHGVVHRDIKPDNVMLSGRHALVVDFGVAKAVSGVSGQGVRTATGVALGTPAYMAPEQAVADPHQDHRVDIYALGLLGYELLTGRGPFVAATAQELLAAHVTAEPEPVERHRPEVSPGLAQVVMRCLAKKPADRWQTAEEVRAQLEPLATPTGGTTPFQTTPVAAVRARRRLVAAGAIVALATIGVLAFQVLRPKPRAITLSDITQVTSEPGVEFQPAISPDGKDVAFVAGPIGRSHVFVRSTANIAGGAAIRLGDTTAGGYEYGPEWSPDGDMVLFAACRGFDCAPIETSKFGGGGHQVTIPARTQRGLWWASSPDETRIAYRVRDTIFVYSRADSSERRIAVHRNSVADLNSFVWSPDGTLIAYVDGNTSWIPGAGLGGSSIWTVSAAGGEPQQVTPHDARLYVNPAWLDSRHLLFVSNRDGLPAVYVVEVGSHGARGEPRLVPGVTDPHTFSYSIRAKTLAWAKFIHRQNLRAYPLGRSTPASIRDGRPVTTGNRVIEACDVSPDGRWIAFDNNRGGHLNVYKMPLAGGEEVPLTDAAWDETMPRWSPDGTEIAFTAHVHGAGSSSITVVPAAGGTPVGLTPSQATNDHPTWSPDGLRIAFRHFEPGHGTISVVSRDRLGGPWHEATQLADVGCYDLDWAPDGSVLACHGRDDKLLLVSPQTGQVVRSDMAAGNRLSRLGELRYSRDGRTIYASALRQDGRQGIWAIPVSGGPARLVVAFDDPAVTAESFSVGPDRVYLTVSEFESDIWVAKLRW